ncbi:MAG: hypothetical protein WAL32_03445 [Terriglobales bacterium]
MKLILGIGLVVFSAQLFAQNAIPSGTILPVALDHSLNARKVKLGEVIRARVMQDVPLTPSSKLHAGAKVIGRVINVKPATRNTGAQVSFRLDTLVISKHRTSITSDVRALASAMAVEDAQIPDGGPDRGTPAAAWTTNQIGGEVVYRGGGPVANGLRSVGEPTHNGVLVHISGKPGAKCRGETEGNDRLQALWVFSSDACGVYGFANMVIVHAGRSAPVGEITLASNHGNLNVKAGSGMLLRVD